MKREAIHRASSALRIAMNGSTQRSCPSGTLFIELISRLFSSSQGLHLVSLPGWNRDLDVPLATPAVRQASARLPATEDGMIWSARTASLSTTLRVHTVSWMLSGMLAAATVQAEPGDDEEVRPPPGTPGSTVDDKPTEPPPGTPGSAASSAGRKGASSGGSAVDGGKGAYATAPKVPLEDRLQAAAYSRTFVRLFRRRYLGGLGGEVTEDETIVPVYEYVGLRVIDADAPWGKDSLDLRLEGWGTVDAVDVSEDRRLTGDLVAANATGRFGPGYVTVGRQTAVGGAARFTRFDGLMAGVRSSYGLGADAYVGLAVTPRFHDRPEYVLLGSRADSMLKHPEALPSTSMTDAWLAGGKLSWSRAGRFHAAASFHEEHERAGLARQWAAIDISGQPARSLSLGGTGAFDIFSAHLADADGYVDWEPIEQLALSGEVTHSNPSLFLSRSSVLSVFSLDTLTEAGGEVTVRAIPRVQLGVSAWHDWYSDSTSSNRFGGRIRAGWGHRDALVAQIRYARVEESEKGYHAVRGAIAYRVVEPVVATVELHEYLYDVAVHGVDSATYGSTTVEYGAAKQPWKLMLGGFMTRSPFAAMDAQAIARLSYDMDLATGATTP